ncbi:MAG: 16S rRNA (uracil(1498)-N(3))-methyltransferase [Xanthomonadaceae bacterium]|jgi:16S rRNA (uracil1498-N3)-methyltransferase|nr:16S rRNA (uracil(1498)-N(3))-methyltransferase [Xanthomonadaceae bacterium]
MRLTRCYVNVPLRPGTSLTLPDHVANHLTRVLRLRSGDDCTLFNGDGCNYTTRLLSANKREVMVEILSAGAAENESPLRITLLQGIARGEKMDWILQKATELGVAAISPVISERTEVKFDTDRQEKRMAHWRAVIESACGQSGRATVPALATPATLRLATEQLHAEDMKLILDPQANLRPIELAPPPDRAFVIAIGPEGGWSPRDRDILMSAGFTGLRLGPRILRTETAALAAIAALQSRFGDL